MSLTKMTESSGKDSIPPSRLEGALFAHFVTPAQPMPDLTFMPPFLLKRKRLDGHRFFREWPQRALFAGREAPAQDVAKAGLDLESNRL